MGKRVKWMMELQSRCDHPPDCLIFREGLMGDYVECLKCGAALPREWVRAREKAAEKMKGQTVLKGTY